MTLSPSPTVIVGGGFVGLFAAMHLCQQRHPHPIVLIDKSERFVFKPLLYELLSGELSEQQVWPKYEDLLNCDEITFIHDTVTQIDLEKRRVTLASGLSYDYGHLVLGLGSTVHDFGIQGVKDHAFPFRTGEDAANLRQHLRRCLQQASQTSDPDQRQALLTVAIIGAGPAGIEMAATLGDLLPQWAEKFGPRVNDLRIVVVNRSSEILKGDINNGLRETAREALRHRLVPIDLLTGAAADQVQPDRLIFKKADHVHELPTHTVIWTTGNKVNPVIRNLDIPPAHQDKAGRLRVLPTLQLPGHPEVFAAGDCTVLDEPQPATAQVAYQQGAAIATNLNAIAQGQPPPIAEVNLRGTLMKLGLADGAANLFDRLVVTGRSGHLLRQATYLELLPNPVHNFKSTLGWLTDEILQRHTIPPPVPEPSPHRWVPQWAANTAVSLAVITSGVFMWRAVVPTNFETTWRPTGIPALIDQLQAREE